MAQTNKARRLAATRKVQRQSDRDVVLEQQRQDKAKLARAVRNEREIASTMSKLARLMRQNAHRRGVLGAELLESASGALRRSLEPAAPAAVEAASE